MLRVVLARAGFRGVILAAALGAAVAGCTNSGASSSSSAPASPAPASARAAAGTDPCTTTISNRTVGNVYVPSGQTCTLNHVIVDGNITDYGYLDLTTNADIGGNVVAEYGSVIVESGPVTGVVEGNLVLNGPARNNIALDYVRGNLTVDQMGNLALSDWVVSGSLFVMDNGPGAVVDDNVVDGNINCSGDITDPTNGGHPNKVHGHETGQCANLH